MSNEPPGKLCLCIEPLLAGRNDTGTTAAGSQVVGSLTDPKCLDNGLIAIPWLLTDYVGYHLVWLLKNSIFAFQNFTSKG